MSTPKEKKSNKKTIEDPQPNQQTPKNYITTGIGKHLLTPCRRIGLSRKTPNSKALDIFKTSNGSPSFPTPKSSISTEKDVISTPISAGKSPSDAPKSKTSIKVDIAPNNLDDTPKPEPKSKGKARTSGRNKNPIVEIEDFNDVTPTAKKTDTKIEKLNTKEIKELGNSPVKESKQKKTTTKPLKKPIKKTKNNNNDGDLLNTIEYETNDKKPQRTSTLKPVQKSDNHSDSSDEDIKIKSKKRNRISSSDSDSEFLPLKSLVEEEAQIHHPPVKRCINFNDEAILSDSSEGFAGFPSFGCSPKAKKSKLNSKNTSTKTKKPNSKRIILKKNITTEDSDDEMFTSTPEDDKKQIENLVEMVTTLEKEVKQKEDFLEKLKQAEVYRKRHCPEKLQQSIDLWLKGCKESLKDLLIKVQEKGPKDMDTLFKDLHISDEIAEKLKAK